MRPESRTWRKAGRGDALEARRGEYNLRPERPSRRQQEAAMIAEDAELRNRQAHIDRVDGCCPHSPAAESAIAAGHWFRLGSDRHCKCGLGFISGELMIAHLAEIAG